MITDLNSFKESILKNGESLLDIEYLQQDMRSLYDYYLSFKDDRSESIQKYFSEYDKFNFSQFSLAYLGGIVGRDLVSEITEDGLIKIKLR